MAITGSDATITTTARDSLRQTTVDATSVVGSEAVTGPTQKTGHLWWASTENMGAALAGVTPDMANNIANGIEQYRARIQGILDGLNAVVSTNAFQGAGVTASLTKFVEGVKAVSFQYLQRLTDSENEIVTSVAKAYSTQDEQLSSQMNTDASSLTGAIGSPSDAGAATSSNAAGM